MKRSTLAHALITLAVLGVLNGLIWQKEMLLRHGTSLLLPLAPVDPRSLMQGDYMRLRYELSRSLPLSSADSAQAEGRLVVHAGEDLIAAFVRLDDGQPLGPGEHFLRFHGTGDLEGRIGAESFFFEEGQADRYAAAKYGELKVTPSGESVLVGLCDQDRHRLGVTPPAAHAPETR